MNYNMKKLILNEGDTTLDEALPRDLARAYKGRLIVPRDAYMPSSGYGGINKPTRSVSDRTAPGINTQIDFNSSEYKKITPEEALKLFKSGNSRNVYAVLDGKLANTYYVEGDDGRKTRKYDFKVERTWGSSAEAFKKKNGKIVDNTMLLTPEEFYNNAESIYIANEVKVDPEKIKARSTNPESPRNYVDPYGKKYLTRKIDDSVVLNSDGTVYVPGSYGGTGDADFWLAKYKDYVARWSESDRDAQTAYDAYILASTGKREYKDVRKWSKVKDARAAARYNDAEKALKQPINDLKSALKDTEEIKQKISKVSNQKAAFSSPEARQRRQGEIQYYIDRYKQSILRYLSELEKYESKLDDLDERDLEEIKEFDRKIADLTTNLADAKKKIDDAKAGKLLPRYNKENVLDQVVDELDDIDNVTESLHEDAGEFDDSSLSSIVRNLIGACWADVDKYSSYLITFADDVADNEELSSTVDQLINNLYITIGILEGLLPEYDPNSEVLDTPVEQPEEKEEESLNEGDKGIYKRNQNKRLDERFLDLYRTLERINDKYDIDLESETEYLEEVRDISSEDALSLCKFVCPGSSTTYYFIYDRENDEIVDGVATTVKDAEEMVKDALDYIKFTSSSATSSSSDDTLGEAKSLDEIIDKEMGVNN